MPPIDSIPTLDAAIVARLVSAYAATAAPKTGARATDAVADRGADSEDWRRLLDRLAEWQLSAGKTDEDDLQNPVDVAIDNARLLLTALRDAGLPQPDRVVPDGEGGVVLEQTAGDTVQRVEFSAQGHVEHVVFQDCKLVSRRECM